MSVLSFVFVFLLSFQVIIDTDYFWHLGVGEYIFNNLTIPRYDLFSFSLPNYPYVYYEWGSEVIISIAYKLLGSFGVSLLYASVLTFSMLVIYKTAETITRKKPFLPLFILFTPVAYAVVGGRLRVFGFLMLSLIYLLFCEFVYKKSKLIWVLPLIFILWVNLHGSFVLGLGIFWILSVLVFLTKRDLAQLRTLGIIGVLSVFSTLLNPYFFRIWNQVLVISGNYYSNLQYINLDWQSLLSKDGRGWILAVFAFLLLGSLFLKKNKVELWQKLLLLFFLLLSVKTARFAVALFVFLLTPLNQMVLEIKEKINLRKTDKYFLSFIVLLIFFVLALGIAANLIAVKYAYSTEKNYADFLTTKFPRKYSYMNWPYKAGLKVTTELSGKRVLNEANWGSLLLMLDPNFKVFYYGAMDNFVEDGKPFAVEYLSIVNAENGWQEKIAKYEIDAVFLPPVFPLVAELRKGSGWSTYYEDKQAVILVKN